MKKKVMNIKPQEVTENGERTVRYKGSDGKFHNIAAGSQQNTPSSNTQQSVEVGEVSENVIMLEQLQENRIYEITTQQGSCLLVTSSENGEMAMQIINGNDGAELPLVESIAQDEQERWVITLDSDATGVSMSLLSDKDAMKAMVGNHQKLIEEFLNYDVLASLKRLEEDAEIGSATYDSGNGAYIICSEEQIDRNATLTLVAELTDNGRKSTVIKTFKLRDWVADLGSFAFQGKAGNLILTVPQTMTSFTVFRLGGVLGTVVDYVNDPKINIIDNVGFTRIDQPENGYRAIVKDGEVTDLRFCTTLNDDYMVNEIVTDHLVKGPNLVEFVQLEDATAQGGSVCYAIINGKPYSLTPFYNGGPDPSQGF